MTPASSPGGPPETGLGQVLRSARTARGLSLADLQSRIKVRAKYLLALEDERYEDLPPFPYARGFVLAAAEELGLDPGPLISRLSSVMMALPAAQSDDWRRLDAAVTAAVPRSRLRRIMTTAGTALVIVGIALAVYFARQLREFSQPPPPQIATGPPAPAGTPDASTPLPAASGDTPSSAPPSPGAQTSPTPESSAPQVSAPKDLTLTGTDGLTLDIHISGVSWLRVIADGRALFEGLLRDGDSRRWQAQRTLMLRVGNGAAVSGTVNGQSLGVFGGNGEVVDRTFTLVPP